MQGWRDERKQAVSPRFQRTIPSTSYSNSSIELTRILIFMQAGEPRTPEDTKREILAQIHLAKLPGATEKLKNATAKSGISDSTTRMADFY